MAVVFVAFSVSWFCVVHWCICCRYGWTRFCAVSGFVCVDRIVMSSAYVISLMFGVCGVGRSDV